MVIQSRTKPIPIKGRDIQQDLMSPKMFNTALEEVFKNLHRVQRHQHHDMIKKAAPKIKQRRLSHLLDRSKY